MYSFSQWTQNRFSEKFDGASVGRLSVIWRFFSVLSLRCLAIIASLSLAVIPVATGELTRVEIDQQFALEKQQGGPHQAGPVEGGPQMKRSYSTRVKSFLIIRKRKRLPVEVAEAVCLLEKTLAKGPLNGEPELPKHYRHIRSAIGALLILGRESEY
jgi:hypothetical protein